MTSSLINSPKAKMPRKDHWLTELVETFNKGCNQSQFIITLKGGDKTIDTGRELCLTLWPFISCLPGNIKRVREKLPDSMDDAIKLFDHLSDEHGHYQNLYMNQCRLAGIEEAELKNVEIPDETKELCALIEFYCQKSEFEEGVLAIIAAELAATVFARQSLNYFEEYFGSYAPEDLKISLDDGLAWLRLHAKPQPRHAIWMKRTIEKLPISSESPPNKFPKAVESLVAAIFCFWRCNNST